MKIIIDTGQDGKVINARVRQKTATLSQWLDKNPVILDGEQAFIIRGDGTPLNFRIGDGSKKFSELPDWVAYEQGTYAPVAGSALPNLGAEIRYTWVGPGTYTQTGGPAIVVPSGYMGVLSWDGSVWSLSQSAEMPGNSAKIADWEQGTYETDEVVTVDGAIYRALKTTTKKPEAYGEDWEPLSIPSVAGDNLLKRRRVRVTTQGAVFPNADGYDSSDLIPVEVGDTFVFRDIIRSGGNLTNSGITGWSDDNEFLKVPDNVDDHDYMYTHKDPTIKKIVFCCNRSDYAGVYRLSRESAISVYSDKPQILDNFFITDSDNEFYERGTVLTNEDFPLNVKLSSKTSSSKTDENTATFRALYANVRAGKQFGTVIVRMGRIYNQSVEGISLTVGRGDSPKLREGDLYKFFWRTNQQISKDAPTVEIRSTVDSGVSTDFEIEVLSIAFNSHTELSAFSSRNTADISMKSVSVVSPFLIGEVWTVMGDSVDAANGYTLIIANDTGMEVNNIAQGGAAWPNILREDRLSLIDKKSVLVTIGGGRNIWRADTTPLSELDVNNRDSDNIIGLMNKAIDYVHSEVPQAVIAFITPFEVLDPDRNDYVKRSRNAMLLVGDNRNVQVWDWYRWSGWGQHNITLFSGDGLHPNFDGYQYMAGFLKKCIPLPLFRNDVPTLNRTFNMVKQYEE